MPACLPAYALAFAAIVPSSPIATPSPGYALTHGYALALQAAKHYADCVIATSPLVEYDNLEGCGPLLPQRAPLLKVVLH